MQDVPRRCHAGRHSRGLNAGGAPEVGVIGADRDDGERANRTGFIVEVAVGDDFRGEVVRAEGGSPYDTGRFDGDGS